MTDDLLAAVRDLPKCRRICTCRRRAARTRCCERMKRGYTVEEYREMLARIRESIPDAAVTSDFIVGFCGETDEDFQPTVELVRESRFKNSFIFKYSERPGTKGAELYRRRRARRREAPPQQRAAGGAERRSARRTTSRSSAARWRCWSKARAKRPKSTATDGDVCNSPAARTATGSSSSTAIAAQIGQFLPVVDLRRQRPHAVRRRRHRARRAGSVRLVTQPRLSCMLAAVLQWSHWQAIATMVRHRSRRQSVASDHSRRECQPSIGDSPWPTP